MKKWLGLGAWLLAVGLLLTACSQAGRPGLSVYLNMNQGDVDRAASVDSRPVRFVVVPGAPARTIGQQLEQAGLIRDATLFEAYVRVNGLDNALQAGAFVLDPSMTLRQVVDTLQRGRASTVVVTVPEGWRLEQTADYLASAHALAAATGAETYRQKAQAGDLSGLNAERYPFLQQRPAGAGLEGYLFPDTYDLPDPGATADDLLMRQIDNFARQVVPRYAAARAAGQTQLSLHEVLTLASIVEREAVVPDERPQIAGVYLNRLAQGMKLDADPTVQYALGFQPSTGQWWKTPVSLDEYGSVDSPYNTYLHTGLPPGPIAAPGLSSIEAVLNPAQHDFLYFVALPDGSGRHAFAATFDEHQQNVQRYLGGK